MSNSSSFVDIIYLLSLLGRGGNDVELIQFLQSHQIHDRPKTAAQLREEDFIEDDGDTDVDYELEKAAKASLMVESERLGFCLIFVTAKNYALVHEVPLQNREHVTPQFILEQIVFFAKGVQIYQQYSGSLPGGLSFPLRQSDPRYAALGQPLARRLVYDSACDLFLIDGLIVNFGFGDEADPWLAHVHVRRQHKFDAVMLLATSLSAAPAQSIKLAHSESTSILGELELGLEVADASVQRLFASLGIEQSDMYQGACPDEITQLTQPKGITLYFDDVANTRVDGLSVTGAQQRLVSVTLKRRGDLSSLGYGGTLPFQFAFGDMPAALIAKAGRAPDAQHSSDQLLSYYWKFDAGLVVHAACSLIDWQLYRITLHAPFMAAELGV
jgi:hypothetical protein